MGDTEVVGQKLSFGRYGGPVRIKGNIRKFLRLSEFGFSIAYHILELHDEDTVKPFPLWRKLSKAQSRLQ
ncbi:hypothetical protein M1146_03815 [Patescibacteria group bacterium]|nr:hypothetical protein [Patescibacteria group bacterium]